MTEGKRRAEHAAGQSRRWGPKGIAIAVVSVAVLGSGAYAAATHHDQLRLPKMHAAASPDGSATKNPAKAAVAAEPAEVTFATKTFALWARPGLKPATWWAALSPSLSAQARQEIEGTNPAYLPKAKLSGKPTVLARTNGVFARIQLPTTQGVFVVDVVRRSATSAWQLDRIGFPKAPA